MWWAPFSQKFAVISPDLARSTCNPSMQFKACTWIMTKGACTHTGKTGAVSVSGAGCNVNICVFSHAAGPAELTVRQISVPDLNMTSRAPGRRPVYQFQCKCVGTCTRVWACRCWTTVLNTSVCMKPTRCFRLRQRVSNCGPRTTSGPRVLPLWSF